MDELESALRQHFGFEKFRHGQREVIEKILARKDTLAYRSAKFIKRNKVGVAAAALVLIALVGGMIATAWQARVARAERVRAEGEKAREARRFNQVRKLAHSVLFDYHDAIANLTGSTPVRERLVKDALEYLDSLAQEASDRAATDSTTG